MHLVLLAAVAHHRVIGIDNQLPWHLPEDLKRFKALTTGNVVVMGRKTFDSIVDRLGKPLPNRLSVVLSRNREWQPSAAVMAQAAQCGAHVRVIHALQDLESAIAGHAATDAPVYVIGGAQLYEATLPMADALDITQVDLDVTGDAFFPEIHDDQWVCHEGDPQVSEQGGLRYRFVRYVRKD
ncbi:MAG: hypothetical protein RL676_544 [Pseudomonadota bacterium]|jgi:dihydrofolate reductase